MTGAPTAPPPRSDAGSAAMNSDTRMPAPRSLRDAGASCSRCAGDVEAAFGGALLAPLRHQAGGMRPRLDRDRDHLVGRRHFEVERLGDLGLQARDVVVADMPAILAQMRGDAVGAGLDRELRRLHRIGMRAAARIADGRNVVDVDAKAQMGNRRHRLDSSMARLLMPRGRFTGLNHAALLEIQLPEHGNHVGEQRGPIRIPAPSGSGRQGFPPCARRARTRRYRDAPHTS